MLDLQGGFRGVQGNGRGWLVGRQLPQGGPVALGQQLGGVGVVLLEDADLQQGV